MSNKVKAPPKFIDWPAVDTRRNIAAAKRQVAELGGPMSAAEAAKHSQARAKRLELGLDPDMDLSNIDEFFALLEAVNPDAIERE